MNLADCSLDMTNTCIYHMNNYSYDKPLHMYQAISSYGKNSRYCI